MVALHSQLIFPLPGNRQVGELIFYACSHVRANVQFPIRQCYRQQLKKTGQEARTPSDSSPLYHGQRQASLRIYRKMLCFLAGSLTR